MSSDKRVPVDDTDLTNEEIEVVLKALGYYQVHLFDEISKNKNSNDDVENGIQSSASKDISLAPLMSESKSASFVIKKIHKILEEREKEHPSR
ncbi:MAG TPA: hypothetical protein VFF30_06475 [Nitrososphaerales archaeon]|nr:hypothetical protein [Nitrososphaerales archaeon]